MVFLLSLLADLAPRCLMLLNRHFLDHQGPM
jgi:hypothetical protein